MLNTIILAIDHYGIEPSLESDLNDMNFAFTIIFCIEMGFKIIGLGLKDYLKETMNYLDGSVVILSVVELVFLSGSGGSLSAFRTVRIFRTFRVLRVARLLKTMQSMQVILGVIARSISSFIYLALLLLLFIFIYSLMGMQLFAGIYDSDWEGPKPRGNFDSFGEAFITVFQVMTMENWQDILYSTMSQAGFIAPLYLISWIFIGNFVLLNLFLAILLDSFVEEDEEEKKEMKEQNIANTPEVAPYYDSLKSSSSENKANLKDKEGDELLKAIELQIKYELGHDDDNKDGKKFVKRNKKKIEKDNLLDESIEITQEILAKKESAIKPTKPLYEGVECENSFYFIKKQNPIRLLIYKLTKSKWFETFILVIIIFSSLKLVVDTYLINKPSDDPLLIVSNYLDLFFTIFFALESLVNSIAIGFVQDKGSYLRESWNKLDFFIVVTSIVDLAFDGINLPVIKILRLLRTLRPLRFISHNSGMKIVVVALIESVGHIMNVAIVVVVVWLMFAILGVNLFGGKFQYCSVDKYEIHNQAECDHIHKEWKTYDFNFDNVPSAMLTLFSVSSLEGWPDIMYQGIDATGVETGPKQDNSILQGFFFIAFILIGSFFFLNFFVGVIFLNFEEAQKEERNALLLNDNQLKWIDIMKMIINAKPDIETIYVPKNK